MGRPHLSLIVCGYSPALSVSAALPLFVKVFPHHHQTFPRPSDTRASYSASGRSIFTLCPNLVLLRRGSSPVAHFLIRLLFCLHAEDVGLLPKDTFTQLVQRARNNPAAFVVHLAQLFQVAQLYPWGAFRDPGSAAQLPPAQAVFPLVRSSLNPRSTAGIALGTLSQSPADLHAPGGNPRPP